MITQNDLEKLGTKLAADCSWVGEYILEAAICALQDANFHHEAEVLNQIVEALHNADGEVELRFEVSVKEVKGGDNEIPF